VPPDVADYFLDGNSPKFLTREDNLSKLSAFFRFCLKVSRSPHLRAQRQQNLQTIFGYSIVKYRKKQKGAATF
jgi:hypothetical protein